MNKRNVLIFIVMVICAGLWWKTQSSTTSVNTKTSSASTALILAKDQERLESHLSAEVLSNENWHKVNDYTLAAKELVTPANSKGLFAFSQKSAKDLASCLKKDFCGMEKRNENDSYFDTEKTPGHILLGRNLDIMIESLRQNPDLKNELDWDLMTELTNNENEKVQVLSLEIIKNYHPGDNDKLLEIADNYSGNAKARALESIASKVSMSDRVLFVNSLAKSFSENDPHTVISIVESIGKFRLSANEIVKVSRNLCHFKDNGTGDPNWKMIRYQMNKVTDLDKICN